MKDKEAANFWFGFVLATVAIVAFYWWWQRQKEVAPLPLVIARPPTPPSPKPEAEKSDDLESIRGIGPVFAGRLRSAGITTFARLAATSPEELQVITKAAGQDPAEWVAEAKRMTQET